MEPTGKGAPPSETSPGGEPVPSSTPDEDLGVPSPDPSDPDALLYAQARARPDWTTKPAVTAALADLCRDLKPGEDPFFWEVVQPGEIKISDKEAHVALTLSPAEEPAGKPTGLESGRLYVADPRGLPTVRAKPKQNPPLVPPEITLVSGPPPLSSASPKNRPSKRSAAFLLVPLIAATAVSIGIVRLFLSPSETETEPAGSPMGTLPSPVASPNNTPRSSSETTSTLPTSSLTQSGRPPSAPFTTQRGVAPSQRPSSQRTAPFLSNSSKSPSLPSNSPASPKVRPKTPLPEGPNF